MSTRGRRFSSVCHSRRALLDSMLEEGPNEEGKEKILQIIDRVDEEKWEKLKEEEHERLLNS